MLLRWVLGILGVLLLAVGAWLAGATQTNAAVGRANAAAIGRVRGDLKALDSKVGEKIDGVEKKLDLLIELYMSGKGQ